jgi:hypothetical protein
MKYYSIELLRSAAERLQAFLYDMGVRFEISAAGAYYHFEILTDATGADQINNFITADAITEV